ncbi:MAG: hypothetical protein AAGN35_22695 [Bacteroidota bacterium]
MKQPALDPTHNLSEWEKRRSRTLKVAKSKSSPAQLRLAKLQQRADEKTRHSSTARIQALIPSARPTGPVMQRLILKAPIEAPANAGNDVAIHDAADDYEMIESGRTVEKRANPAVWQTGDQARKARTSLMKGLSNQSQKKIGKKEDITVISHGSRPEDAEQGKIAGTTMNRWAKVIESYLPPRYSGKIFLDACYTAARRIRQGAGGRYHAVPGTSNIERLAAALNSMAKSTVYGNLAASATVIHGGGIVPDEEQSGDYRDDMDLYRFYRQEHGANQVHSENFIIDNINYYLYGTGTWVITRPKYAKTKTNGPNTNYQTTDSYF